MRKQEALSQVESPSYNIQNINTETVQLNDLPAIDCNNNGQTKTQSYESKTKGTIQTSTTTSEVCSNKNNQNRDFIQKKEDVCFLKAEGFKEYLNLQSPIALLQQYQDIQIDQINVSPQQLIQKAITKQIQKKHDEEIQSEFLLQELYTQSQLDSYYIIKKFDKSSEIDLYLVSITILCTSIVGTEINSSELLYRSNI
ncbi:hypothetical protein ABPG72_012188 [Tetrahymena utriculariae]